MHLHVRTFIIFTASAIFLFAILNMSSIRQVLHCHFIWWPCAQEGPHVAHILQLSSVSSVSSALYLQKSSVINVCSLSLHSTEVDARWWSWLKPRSSSSIAGCGEVCRTIISSSADRWRAGHLKSLNWMPRCAGALGKGVSRVNATWAACLNLQAPYNLNTIKLPQTNWQTENLQPSILS